MTTTKTCDWDTGTVYTGPRICGKPAKFNAVDDSFDERRLVCGVHVRSARKLNYVVSPIDKQD